MHTSTEADVGLLTGKPGHDRFGGGADMYGHVAHHQLPCSTTATARAGCQVWITAATTMSHIPVPWACLAGCNAASNYAALWQASVDGAHWLPPDWLSAGGLGPLWLQHHHSPDT